MLLTVLQSHLLIAFVFQPLQAINAYAKSKGSGQVSVQAVLDDSAHSEAATVAAASDVCIVCVGANSGEGCKWRYDTCSLCPEREGRSG